jgi:hypothetical protein
MNMNFLGLWMERRGRPIAWPPLSPFGFFSLGLCERQVYRQRVNTLDEIKAWITAAIADVTKDMLQRDWEEVDCRWMYAELQLMVSVKCFTSNRVSTCV